MKDSVLVATDSIAKLSTGFLEISKNPADNLAFSFWLSVLLLIFISLLKYFIAKKCERRDVINFILEFPIDLCLIVITVIITGVMKEPNLKVGIILLGFSLIISVFCCIFRRLSIQYSYDSIGKSFLYALLDVLLALIWTSFICFKCFQL